MQRLTYGDFVALRRAASLRSGKDAKIAYALMKQTRDRRAKEIRNSFSVVQGGKA